MVRKTRKHLEIKGVGGRDSTQGQWGWGQHSRTIRSAGWNPGREALVQNWQYPDKCRVSAQ